MKKQPIKRNIKKRIGYLIWYSDLEMTRFGLALGALLWALLLFWPGTLFAPERTTYSLMSAIASEELWGVAFMVQGVTMLYSLLWGYKSRVSFVLDALLGCVLWTASTAACFIAHYTSSHSYQPPAAMAYEVVGSLMSWWVMVRYCSINKGE